jgi:hypothetical protein
MSKENHDHRTRKVEEQQRVQDLASKQETAAQGARMGALDASVDEILKAAKHLEKEIRRETKYWHEIVSVSDKGWPIQRLRQNVRHAPFAVRYGLPEGKSCSFIRCCLELTASQQVITSKLVASRHFKWTRMAASSLTQHSH